MKIDPEPSWMDPIIEYLKSGTLPEDKLEAKKLLYHSSKYCLIEDKLYRRLVSSPLLKCLGPTDSAYALKEVHEGI